MYVYLFSQGEGLCYNSLTKDNSWEYSCIYGIKLQSIHQSLFKKSVCGTSYYNYPITVQITVTMEIAV